MYLKMHENKDLNYINIKLFKIMAIILYKYQLKSTHIIDKR